MKVSIEELKDEIEILRNSKKPIIVEGKRDQIALKNLGIKSLTLKKPLYKIIETISEDNKGCIILTDLDKEGKRLFSKLQENLEKRKVKIDNRFRLFLLTKTTLKQIEGLETYIKRLENN